MYSDENGAHQASFKSGTDHSEPSSIFDVGPDVPNEGRRDAMLPSTFSEFASLAIDGAIDEIGVPEEVVEAVAIIRIVGTVANGKVDGITSRHARRESMRKQGILTSQQPKSQSKNASGREYSYDVPKRGGGKQTKSVQQQTKDRSHKGQPHWEAGPVKTDSKGGTRMNNHGRPKLENSKSKSDY